MIQKVEMFTVVCDNCGEDAGASNEEYSCHCDSGTAMEYSEGDNWVNVSVDVQYCPQCAHYDDEDNLVLDESRKVIAEDTPTDFLVECTVCGGRLENWSGSTPCCGALAYIVENDVVTTRCSLFALMDDGTTNPITVNIKL